MTAIDPYYPSGASGPARHMFAITPDDVAEFEYLSTGIYVGGSGDVVVIDPDSGAAVTFFAVPAGTILPIRVARVMTATTATNLTGMA